MNRIFTNPFFWVTLSAVFFGASLSRTTRRVPKSILEERARSVKWTFVTIYLSISIIFGLLAVFIPGPEKILNINLVYLFAVVSVLFFLAFRFKRLFGTPLVLLSFIVLLTILLFLQSFDSFT